MKKEYLRIIKESKRIGALRYNGKDKTELEQALIDKSEEELKKRCPHVMIGTEMPYVSKKYYESFCPLCGMISLAEKAQEGELDLGFHTLSQEKIIIREMFENAFETGALKGDLYFEPSKKQKIHAVIKTVLAKIAA